MAMEKAVVSTSIGAEGLPVTDGDDIVLADSPEGFASSVIRLLNDPVRAGEIGRRAAHIVRAEFGWDRVAAKFAAICARVAEPGLAPAGMSQ
jgi:glycosyltransferase involved in cell wall biosynthesis